MCGPLTSSEQVALRYKEEQWKSQTNRAKPIVPQQSAYKYRCFYPCETTSNIASEINPVEPAAPMSDILYIGSVANARTIEVLIYTHVRIYSIVQPLCLLTNLSEV